MQKNLRTEESAAITAQLLQEIETLSELTCSFASPS